MNVIHVVLVLLFKREGNVQFIRESTSGWGGATVLGHERRLGGTTGRSGILTPTINVVTSTIVELYQRPEMWNENLECPALAVHIPCSTSLVVRTAHSRSSSFGECANYSSPAHDSWDLQCRHGILCCFGRFCCQVASRYSKMRRGCMRRRPTSQPAAV